MPSKLFGFLPVYSLLIVLAIVIALLLCTREEKRLGLPADFSIEMLLCLLPAAIIGARLYYVAFQWDQYRGDLLSILKLWNGGLAIYGGVIGGAIAAFFFARRKKVPFGVVTDLAAPALILGQAIGRWGNFFNGEAYGARIESPAWQFFPAAVFVDNHWYMATFFYESIWDFSGFLLLWYHRKKVKHTGNLFLLYLVWYGAGRALIEGLRTDSLYLGALRISQVLSIVLCLGALLALCLRSYLSKRAKNPPTP